MFTSFVNLSFMFITSVLIENFISIGIICGLEEYIQEGQLQIYIVINLTANVTRTSNKLLTQLQTQTPRDKCLRY